MSKNNRGGRKKARACMACCTRVRLYLSGYSCSLTRGYVCGDIYVVLSVVI